MASRDEGQQPLIRDVLGGETVGAPYFSVFDHGIASISTLTFLGLRRLLPLRLVALSRLACDHDSLCYYADIVFQC